jgi:hypothetical protein
LSLDLRYGKRPSGTAHCPQEFIDWRAALVIVKPETFFEWHRELFGFSALEIAQTGSPAVAEEHQATGS